MANAFFFFFFYSIYADVLSIFQDGSIDDIRYVFMRSLPNFANTPSTRQSQKYTFPTRYQQETPCLPNNDPAPFFLIIRKARARLPRYTKPKNERTNWASVGARSFYLIFFLIYRPGMKIYREQSGEITTKTP